MLCRAFSWNQLKESGFAYEDYTWLKAAGTYRGRLDFKLWGKWSDLIAAITLEDGRKVKCHTYQRDDYLDIDKLPMDTLVEFTLSVGTKGSFYLSEMMQL